MANDAWIDFPDFPDDSAASEQGWRPKIPGQDDNQRNAPRYRHSKIPEGQDFETMTAKHGRPIGPFEHGREHNYRATIDRK